MSDYNLKYIYIQINFVNKITYNSRNNLDTVRVDLKLIAHGGWLT